LITLASYFQIEFVKLKTVEMSIISRPQRLLLLVESLHIKL